MRKRTPADMLVSLLTHLQLHLPKLTLKELRLVMKGIIAKATVWGTDRMEITISIPAGGKLYDAGAETLTSERRLYPRSDLGG